MDADPFWTDRHVLVSGCTSFLGSWTSRFLVEAGARVVGLVPDRVAGSELHRSRTAKRIQLVRRAIVDAPRITELLDDHRIQTVFHFPTERACPVDQTSTLLEAMTRSRLEAEVVLASSGQDDEGMSADMLALSYAHSHGVAVCVAGVGDCFGGGDLDFRRLVPRTMLAVLRGETPRVTASDHGRDRIYVKEAARAHLHLAERVADNSNLSGRAFHFSGTPALSGTDLVKRILSQLRSPLVPEVLPRLLGSEPPNLEDSRARTELGWAPRYSLDDALRETIAWYRAHFAVPMVRAA